MQTKRMVAALAALGQDTRLELFRLLVQRGPGGLPAGTIAEKLAVPPSSLTFHLQQLTHAGLIASRRVGRQLIYAANFQTMNEIIGYLTENCCGGDAALCAPVCKPAKAEMPIRKKRSAA
jgi:DNA-binding transcriptional ArsR family regulator